MHPRHRSPGNGYRSSPMGIGGVAAASRISPESSIRGHGMYNSDYRSYNRGFGRGQPKPYQAPPAPPPPLPPRRPDIFMEAGRLATEYLVSKGFLPPNVLSGRMQNGSFRNQIGEFQGFRPQEGDSLHLTPDGRTSALARLGSASDTGSGRRRFGDEYNNPTGSRSSMRGRRRMESFKNYGGSDLGQGMGRSASFPDKARASSDMEGDTDSFSGYPEEQQLGYRGSNDGQMSEAAPKTDGAGDSRSGLEKSQFQDDTSTKVSSDIEKDCPPENDVEVAKKSDDVNLLNEDIVELNDGTSSEQVEKQSEMKDAPIQQLAIEGDPINKNGVGLLSLCGFAKIPTRTRSSLTARGPKVDPVPTTEDIKKCDQGQEDDNCDIGPPMGSEVPVKDVSVDSSSVDASSNQIQHSKCLDSDIIGTPVIMSAEDTGELGPVYTEQGKYVRSESYPDSSFIKKQEPSEGPPGFGSSSSMIMEERGKKRTAEQHTDSREGTKKPREWVLSVDAESDENLHISHVTGKQLTSQEGRKSPRDEVIFAKDQERPVDMSPFQSGNAGPCIEYSEEKQLFPSSFKICDLNLMEASEIIENSDRDPLIGFHSIPEIKTEATPVDVDLSISNNCNISGKFGRRGSDGKEVEVIDLENDSLQDDNALNNTERKEETVFTGFESFPNHPQSTNDISDPQDGYGLMFSELLGTDISNCPSVPADIGSLHNDMALHNGEGILGDDESIYMSLGEIPISFLPVWEQPGQEYDKPF